MKKQVFSEEVKKIRISRGFSQAALASMYEISLRTYIKWETGVCEPPEIVKYLILLLVSGDIDDDMKDIRERLSF
jgi:DNA-binding transcriptional regulator YiaG